MRRIKVLLTEDQFSVIWSAVQLSLATPRDGDVPDEQYPKLEKIEAKLKKAFQAWEGGTQ